VVNDPFKGNWPTRSAAGIVERLATGPATVGGVAT